MNRNLSDCAAMACLPAAAVVTVALPKGTTIEYSKELYLGIKEAGDVFDCPIVGGDTATWDGKLLVTVTILGASAGINPITRSGALPGDSLYVTGPLGGSRQRRHMEFQPRVHQARMLAKTGLITAAIDISDGLSRDLAHICEQSGVGAILEGVPIHEDAIGLSDPLQHALHDGEDHELLFTSTASFDALWQRVGEATTEWPIGIIQIGSITAERGIFLADRRGKRTPLEPKGWEHTF